MKISLVCVALFFFATTVKAQSQSPVVEIEGDPELLKNLSSTSNARIRSFDSTQVQTGFLRDKVIFPFINFDKYNGSDESIASTQKVFEQICLELDKSNLKQNTRRLSESQPINYSGVSIKVLNYDYQKIKTDTLSSGSIILTDGEYRLSAARQSSPFITSKIFVSTTNVDQIYEGSGVKFIFKKENYLSNVSSNITNIQVDFDNSLGYQNVVFDKEILVSYSSIGNKTIRVKMFDENNTVLKSSSVLRVNALSIPQHTNINLKADYSYSGVLGSGTISIFKSPLNSELKNPIVFLEGLDLDNTLSANGLFAVLSGAVDGIYEKGNGPDLAKCLLNNGYDIIIVNYDESKTYIQANAMFVVKAIQYINQIKKSKNSIVLIGASMGGLVGRYALSYMEKNNLNHETRLFVSYDSPQKGANIPLGDQFWINFWASQSSDAGLKIKQLNAIAPQQMLVYHHLFSNSQSTCSPLRNTLLSELNTLGYPQKCRKIAITNGSANGVGQPYSPGSQLVSWRFRHWKVDVDGNAWAVPNQFPKTKIMECVLDKFGPQYAKMAISTSYTLPYDNAPGGLRATNKEIANSSTFNENFGDNLGDINTLNPNHCFIPTISALDINTTDLFYNIKNDPNILSKTPFNQIYYPKNNPNENQPHIFITSEIVTFVLNELVPNEVVLNANTQNRGEIAAQNSIALEQGFSVDGNSGLNLTIGSYSMCDLSPNNALRVARQSQSISTEEKNKSDNFMDKLNINVYPNPNNGSFVLSTPFIENANISISNLDGLIVFKDMVKSNLTNINLSSFNSGVYILKITQDNDVITKKIVVEK